MKSYEAVEILRQALDLAIAGELPPEKSRSANQALAVIQQSVSATVIDDPKNLSIRDIMDWAEKITKNKGTAFEGLFSPAEYRAARAITEATTTTDPGNNAALAGAPANLKYDDLDGILKKMIETQEVLYNAGEDFIAHIEHLKAQLSSKE